MVNADVPKPPAPIKVMLAANARREREGLAPRYARMRTVRRDGTYVYHWVVVHSIVQSGVVTFQCSLPKPAPKETPQLVGGVVSRDAG
jgi:hypothetical protein